MSGGDGVGMHRRAVSEKRQATSLFPIIFQPEHLYA